MTTPNILILTPTRGRPEQFRRLVEAVEKTTQGRAQVWGAVDDDDPELEAYLNLDVPVTPMIGARNTLTGWTNELAQQALRMKNQPPYLASLGDDHLPRTRHWDKKLIAAIEALPGPGWAYGDDEYTGHPDGVVIPTAWVVSTEIVRALGWVMLPTCKHMYVDNAVLDLGRATSRITYMPNVKITHLHPAAGKAESDDTYAATNNPRSYAEDRAAHRHWRRGQFRRDMATVLGVTW